MNSWQRLSTGLLLLSFLVLGGAGCGGGGGAPEQEDVTLTYWRVFDNDDAFSDIISAYQDLHPNVNIEYKKLRFDEYEEELIQALAEGTGPDMFAVHNDALGEFKNLLLPLPATTTVSYLTTQGTLRKQTVVEEREQRSLTQKQLKEQYVDVVASDVILPYTPDPEVDSEDRIFGLPLSVDTLALYYNKDLLNAANIATPPKTWEGFQDAVMALTTIANNGTITQSGAALGTSDNVERTTDILTALMLQNGTEMTDDRGRVAFAAIPDGTPEGYYPGLDAVRFYTDFANPTKAVYSWNDTFPNSFDAFANGQTAFFLGYAYHLPLLRTAAPKLNFATAHLPQIDTDENRKVNFANYWVEAVSKDTENADWAWDFIQFASNAEHVRSYLDVAEKPTALRELIDTQVEDELLGPFVDQLLTAKTWYHGADVAAMEEALRDLIDAVLAGTTQAENAIEQAARVVAQTYE